MIIRKDPFSLYKDTGHWLMGFGQKIESPNWQGLGNPVTLIEILGQSLRCSMPQTYEELNENMKLKSSWAEDHFQERVEGVPTNPGKTYRDWPYYKEDSYRAGGKFSHTYQERFWPKQAGTSLVSSTRGIRYVFGDYNDLVDLLFREPETRQAYLPIFFPEDTGAVKGQRIPCTLGYLFTVRGDIMNLTYYMRSCDYIRHLDNDIYMAVRLAQHTLDQLIRRQQNLKTNKDWKKVKLGIMTMHIESLHCFKSDIYELKKRLR